MTEEASESIEQEIEDLIKVYVAAFNEKCESDEKLRAELEGKVRKAQVDITDGKTYSFLLKDSQLQDFKPEPIEEPDIVFAADKETMLGLLKKEINPLKALMITKKLRVTASLEDKLTFRKFF